MKTTKKPVLVNFLVPPAVLSSMDRASKALNLTRTDYLLRLHREGELLAWYQTEFREASETIREQAAFIEKQQESYGKQQESYRTLLEEFKKRLDHQAEGIQALIENRKEAEQIIQQLLAERTSQKEDRKQGGGPDSGMEILVALGLKEDEIAERRSLPEEEQVEALGRYWLVVKALARVGRIPRKAVFPLVGISDEDLRHFVLFDATEEEKKRLRDALLGSEEREVKHGRRKGA